MKRPDMPAVRAVVPMSALRWRARAHNPCVSASPIPRPLRPALSAVVDRLVAGDYEGLKRDGIDLCEACDLGLWIREYGRAPGTGEPDRATLVPLPEEAWDSAEVVFENPGPPRVWAVVVDLWTAEEGRSDLSMEAEVTETSNGLSVVVSDIHVM
jgi:hypothetical protein